jgi:hypothetical protein
MGKGWSKGLSAETDPRVAAMAAAHRGLRYQRQKAAADCKWSRLAHDAPPIGWSASLAYVVGLTATDGCLISGDRHLINFKSKVRELVSLYLRLLGRGNAIGVDRSRAGGVAYRTQFGDARLYDWLLSIGLTPRKSLTLGAISAPAPFLPHLVRGLLDGDGSILNYMYDGTGKAKGRYEALTTCFASASQSHVMWLRAVLQSSIDVRGSIGSHLARDRLNAMYRLAYAKRESERLLAWIYPDDDVPCLSRKRAIWETYRSRHEPAAVQ